MKGWLDDVRPLPPGFDAHARTAAEAIALLERGGFTLLLLGHDLGDPANGLPPLEYRVHSQNPVGIVNMAAALRNAQRFWARGAL